ncbi:MAG: sugar phosphate isomerase/epimerase [Spirochaetia bacterium]|jgi:sugar phosphate isomerase/epimerase
MDTILLFASGLDISCVSLEMRLLPSLDRTYLCALRGTLRALGLEPILAWRPRGGLRTKELIESLEAAVLVGASVLRIIDDEASADDSPSEGLAGMLRSAASIAARQGVTMALENSSRRTSKDLLDLLARVGSASGGISFDTSAALEAGEDPAAAAARLGRWIKTVQASDHQSLPGVVRELRSCGFAGSLIARIDSAVPEDMIRESVVFLKGLAQA